MRKSTLQFLERVEKEKELKVSQIYWDFSSMHSVDIYLVIPCLFFLFLKDKGGLSAPIDKRREG